MKIGPVALTFRDEAAQHAPRLPATGNAISDQNWRPFFQELSRAKKTLKIQLNKNKVNGPVLGLVLGSLLLSWLTLVPNRTGNFRFNYELVQSLDTLGKTRIGQKDQVQTEKLNRRFESLKLSTPIQSMSSSQSCSHQNSVQNAPIESSTALTGTTFVTISVFMSRGHFPAPFGQKRTIRNVLKNLRP